MNKIALNDATYNFASRGREYPFGHSRPACRDTRTRETRLAAWLLFVAKNCFL